MGLYYTKEGLYKEIDRLRSHVGIISYSTPINAIALCASRDNYAVGYHNFKTIGLQGMLMVGNDFYAILLSSAQSPAERNFYCTHELIHSALHRNLGISSFSCYEKTKPNQNSFLEWHANEGAAQFPIPYQDFIPRFVRHFTANGSTHILSELACYYEVTPQVIGNRVSNLSYEIDQYFDGTPIPDIRLLSRKQRESRGITVTPYDAVCDFAFTRDSVIV